MVPKKFYKWDDVQRMCADICRQITLDGWRPDYIVGITRGGNIPATLISHYLNVRCETLNVKLRDGEPDGMCESNCWMSEDAFGYVDKEERQDNVASDSSTRKNILIVDDINDTGATLNWIKQDWMSSCLPQETSGWDSVWHRNVRFAVITDNLSSEFKGTVDYSVHEVNKAEDDVWLVYPWEAVGNV